MDDWLEEGEEEEEPDSALVSTIAHALADFAESLPSGTEVCTYDLLEHVASRNADVAGLLAPYVEHSDGDAQQNSLSRYPMGLLLDLDESVCELLEERGIYPDALESEYATVGLPYLIPYQLRREVSPPEIATRSGAPAIEGLRFSTCSFWTGEDDFIAVMGDGSPHFTRFRSHADDPEGALVDGRLSSEQWSELEHALHDLDVYSLPTAPDLQVLDAPSWTLIVTFEGGRYFKAEDNIEQPPNLERLVEILEALESEDS